MSEQTETQAALQTLLAQMQQSATAGAGTVAGAAGGGWNAAQATGPAALIQGVAVPIKVSTPAGEMRAYLSLPAEVGQNPQALIAVLQQLANAGYPLDTWQPKNSGGDWGGGQQGGGWNNGGGGGYRNNYGGGYRRGGRW